MSKDIAIFDLRNAGTRKAVIDLVKLATPGLYWFEFRRCRNQRTLSQNSYLWGVVYPRVAQGLFDCSGETLDATDAHEFCKSKFLWRPIMDRKNGTAKGRIIRSTVSLDTAEFAEYLDKIITFSAEFLGVEIPSATDYRPAETTK
jgi:hypothetical protein